MALATSTQKRRRVGFFRGDLVVALVAEIRQGDQQERRRQERRAVDAGVTLQEVQRELHALAAFLPGGLQGLPRQAAHGQEARLPGGEGDQVLEVQAEVQVEAPFRALLLERLERLERVPPLGGDLRQRQVGTAQLGAQRVHAHEDLGDLVVGETSLQHVHAIDVFADAAQTRQALAVFLVARIIEPAHACSLQERRIAVRLEDLGHLDPVRQLLQLPRRDDEGHLVEAALQFVLGGIDFVLDSGHRRHRSR